MRRIGITVAVALILPVFGSSGGLAQPSPMWGELEPGPYGIGFRTIESYDFSRTFRPKHDYLGGVIEGERARPIQTCIWYPADAAPDAVPVVYGEYAYAYPEDETFIGVLAGLHNRELGVLGRMARGDRGFMADFLNTSMYSVKNAAAAGGEFPLVIYHPSLRASYCENAVMCEYLASHGYVVATSHPLGMSEVSPRPVPSDLETAVRDRELVAGLMRAEPSVDRNRTGVIGRAEGAAAALIMQMRDSDIDAVVCLGGLPALPNGEPLHESSASWSADRMQVPLLRMAGGEPPEDSLNQELVYSERYTFGFRDAAESDFSMERQIASLVPDSSGEVSAGNNPMYETVCRHVLRFLDAHLKGDEASMAWLTDGGDGIQNEAISFHHTPGDDVPPTPTQFMAVVRDHGVSEAVEIYDRFRELNPDLVLFQEATFNALGYRSFQQGQMEDALTLFRLNTEAYPNSPNVWDSYGEALLASGRTDEAVSCARKALELLSGDVEVDPGLAEAIRANSERMIGEHGGDQ